MLVYQRVVLAKPWYPMVSDSTSKYIKIVGESIVIVSDCSSHHLYPGFHQIL